MESLILRISSTTIEAVFAGVAIGGILALVRKIQMAFGARNGNSRPKAHLSGF